MDVPSFLFLRCCVPGDDCQEGFAVALGLDPAHTGDIQEVLHSRRGPGRHVRQYGVGEDDVRRHIVPPSQTGALRLQRRQQTAVRRGRLPGWAIAGRRSGLLLHSCEHGHTLPVEEDLPCPGGGTQGAVLTLRADVALGLQALQARAQTLSGFLPHQTVSAQPVQPQVQNPLAPAAPQDLGNKGRAHVVAQVVPHPLDAGEDHLGVDCHVRLSEEARACATVSAPVRVRLTKVVQNTAPQALGALAVVHHNL